MGLLGNLLQTLGGTAKSGADHGALGSIMELINSQGGVDGVVGKLKKGGLENIVDSWIGTGKNKAVKSEQISKILGSDVVKQLAAKLGISPATAAAKLSQYLPQIIDKLTPDGKQSSLPKNINIQDVIGMFLKK